MIKVDSRCSACQACIQICPRHCVSLDDNYRVQVASDECINCGACQKVCQLSQSVKLNTPIDIYAAYNRDVKELYQSSSGGIGGLLLRNNLLKDFKVFSAINNQCIEPIIDEIFLHDIHKAIKSKYCFSDINNSYVRCKDYLDRGFNVLYLALPCQVAGLKLYLKKDYGNLFCVDIFCHGAPAPIELRRQINYKSRNDKRVVDLQFRDKSVSRWGDYCYLYRYSDGSTSSGPALCDFYFSNFLKGSFLRECCYQCQYACFERVGDLSIGDYWHIKTKHLNRDINGISAVLVNNKKGKYLWNIIKEFCEFEQGSKQGVENATHAIVQPIKYPRDYMSYVSVSQWEYNKIARKYECSLLQIARMIRFKLRKQSRSLNIWWRTNSAWE